MMAKIQMTTPLVEMDGDEMTRIIWRMVKWRSNARRSRRMPRE